MQKFESRLTIYFEEPFWVGMYERISDGLLEVCKITFGAEPKDYEVFKYLLENWHVLRFSPPVEVNQAKAVKINPKRMHREIRRQMERSGTGTKSQEALKLQYEENKIVSKQKKREQRETEKKERFELRQQKKKEKLKGH